MWMLVTPWKKHVLTLLLILRMWVPECSNTLSRPFDKAFASLWKVRCFYSASWFVWEVYACCKSATHRVNMSRVPFHPGCRLQSPLHDSGSKKSILLAPPAAAATLRSLLESLWLGSSRYLASCVQYSASRQALLNDWAELGGVFQVS